MDRYLARLQAAPPAVRELVLRVPLMPGTPQPPEWLRCEMLERWLILETAPLAGATSIVEVGSGPHAISTVPLAYYAGPRGRVLALERARWAQFRAVVEASGVAARVRAVQCDARRLPLRANAADVAVCVHGIRSFRGDANAVRIVREMLRVAPRVFLAESLPVARTEAQRAHLEMYGLREEVFRDETGSSDDLRYAPLERLASIVSQAGGTVDTLRTVDVDLPHFLGWFPRSYVLEVPEGGRRNRLLAAWDAADARLRRSGEDHPPVGVVSASRRMS